MNACNLRAKNCEQMLDQKQNKRTFFDIFFRVEHKLYSMRKLEDNRKRGEKVPNTQTLKSISEPNPRFPEKRNIVVDSPD